MTELSKSRFFDRKTQPSMFTLVLLASISMLAMNSFLPSLPSMALHFGTTTAVMGLSVAIYLGSSAVLQILVGPLSDKIGRRPALLWSLGIFIFASFACIFAQTTATFMVTLSPPWLYREFPTLHFGYQRSTAHYPQVTDIQCHHGPC